MLYICRSRNRLIREVACAGPLGGFLRLYPPEEIVTNSQATSRLTFP